MSCLNQLDKYFIDMYWHTNNPSSSHIDEVLQKEGITLQELMDENDIIQECKMQNKKLIEFLCQRNVLEELVTLITEEPSENLDERSRFKYPNIACELLTCDVPVLNETLSRDNELLEKLYSFINKEPPLNPLLASFLSRTLGVLIVKRHDQQWISYQFTCLQAMGFLKDKQNFISLLLKHLGTSAIMDLTLKLITEVGDEEHHQNLLNWLDSQRLVQSLVDLFDPQVDSERHHNVAQLLCDVLRISREALNDHRDRTDTDPILTRLESPETVSQLLDHMLSAPRSESSIVGGIQVLLALLGHKNSFNDPIMYNNAYEEPEDERKLKVAQSTATVITRRLKDFHQILLDPPKKMPVRTTIGVLDPPLGNTRLQVTRLLAALIATNNDDILQEIMNLGLVEVLLDLFFKYVWNNFLHAQVEQCLAAALNAFVKVNDDSEHSFDNAMHPYLVMKCRLLGRILEAWDDNEQKQSKPKGVRQGYMGHLISIANLVVKKCLENSKFDAYIKQNMSKDSLETWGNFVNGQLAESNRLQKIVLGGIHPKNLTSDDSNDDCNIPPYTSSSLLSQQQFNNFQIQQASPHLIDNLCYRDSSLNNSDEHPFDRLIKINLNVSEDIDQQADMFKKICSEYVNTLDDSDDNIFDENLSNRNSESTDDNWDTPANEIDRALRTGSFPWMADSDKSDLLIIDSQNPWSSVKSFLNDSSEDGWADFANFSSSCEVVVPIANLNISSELSTELPEAPSKMETEEQTCPADSSSQEMKETAPDVPMEPPNVSDQEREPHETKEDSNKMEEDVETSTEIKDEMDSCLVETVQEDESQQPISSESVGDAPCATDSLEPSSGSEPANVDQPEPPSASPTSSVNPGDV